MSLGLEQDEVEKVDVNRASAREQAFQVFLKVLTSALGSEAVECGIDTLKREVANTLGAVRTVPAILYPTNRAQIEVIVKNAARFGVKLYPISRGRNTGYGDRSPVRHHQTVVSLERMDRIIDFDNDTGQVTVEPGVTQLQLCNFLEAQGGAWIADVTGGPPDASIVGNTLDGGFGHTPLGNHREQILELEVVLGNGEFLRTGRFPDLGPNLAPLFVQSSFGIVTAMRIPLLRKPVCISTYTLQFKSDDTFFLAIPRIRELCQRGVISSPLHVANATRVFMSTNEFPKDFSTSVVMSDLDCVERMRFPFFSASQWTGIGGLYGTAQQNNQSVRFIKQQMRGLGRVQVFSDSKLKWLQRAVSALFWIAADKRSHMLKGLESLRAISGLCQGIPSAKPSSHIRWKTPPESEAGLIWISPVIAAGSNAAAELMQILRPVFNEFQFELPITITFIDRAHLICIVSLSFSRDNIADRTRAHRAFRAAEKALREASVRCYRKGIVFQKFGIPEERMRTLRHLKNTFDPHHIISPGRYGI